MLNCENIHLSDLTTWAALSSKFNSSMSSKLPNPSDRTVKNFQSSKLSDLTRNAGSTGMGQSLANRVQKTRRDAEDVIEEVLAENSQSLIESLDEDLLEGSNTQDRGSLALFISKDSNTAIVGQNAGRSDIVKVESGNGHEEDNNGHEMTRSLTSKKGYEKVEFGSTF
ncbi:hypothetical protein Ddc_15254 [Ditylenchus destructor]|nr:hypothetical protein Ddc_15254 [Ditylenchus destructor]